MQRNSAVGTNIYHRLVIAIVALILALPIVATVLYSFATEWGATILPDGLTLKWFERLLTDLVFCSPWSKLPYLLCHPCILHIVGTADGVCGFLLLPTAEGCNGSGNHPAVRRSSRCECCRASPRSPEIQCRSWERHGS